VLSVKQLKRRITAETISGVCRHQCAQQRNA
jgi:hypothetical protein